MRSILATRTTLPLLFTGVAGLLVSGCGARAADTASGEALQRQGSGPARTAGGQAGQGNSGARGGQAGQGGQASAAGQGIGGATGSAASGKPSDQSGSPSGAGGESAGEPGATPSSDGQILGVLEAATTAEVEAAAIALERSQSEVIRDYAAGLVDDHTRLEKLQAKVTSRLQLSPAESPESIRVTTEAADALASLASVDARAFDAMFLDAQIQGHIMQLRWIDRAQACAARVTQGLRVTAPQIQTSEQSAQSGMQPQAQTGQPGTAAPAQSGQGSHPEGQVAQTGAQPSAQAQSQGSQASATVHGATAQAQQGDQAGAHPQAQGGQSGQAAQGHGEQAMAAAQGQPAQSAGAQGQANAGAQSATPSSNGSMGQAPQTQSPRFNEAVGLFARAFSGCAAEVGLFSPTQAGEAGQAGEMTTSAQPAQASSAASAEGAGSMPAIDARLYLAFLRSKVVSHLIGAQWLRIELGSFGPAPAVASSGP